VTRSRIGAERRAKERHHPLFQTGSVLVRRRRTVQEARTQLLQLKVRALAPALEQRMKGQRRSGGADDFLEQFQIWRDDELGVVARPRLAQMVALAPGDKQHLIRVADHVVTADVPDEQAAIRETDLKVRGEALGRSTDTHPDTTQVLHEPDA
jgi:hypothetical protein